MFRLTEVYNIIIITNLLTTLLLPHSLTLTGQDASPATQSTGVPESTDKQTLQVQIDSQAQEILNLNLELQQNKAEKDRAHREIVDLKGMFQDQQQLTEKCQLENTTLKSTLQERDSTIATLNSRLEDKVLSDSDLVKEKESLRNLVTQRDSEIQDLTRSKAEFQREAETAKADLAAHADEISTLKAALADRDTTISRLQESNSNLEADLSARGVTIQNLQKKNETLSSNLESFQAGQKADKPNLSPQLLSSGAPVAQSGERYAAVTAPSAPSDGISPVEGEPVASEPMPVVKAGSIEAALKMASANAKSEAKPEPKRARTGLG